MNVDVGTIKRSDLGVGTTAGGKDFNIELQCSGGLSVRICQYQHLFSGTLATNTQRIQGALLNEKTGIRDAKGVGIQVMKDSIPLEFNKKYSIGTLKIRKLATSPCLSMRVFINMRRLPVPVKWSRT
jgi:type 1 fimbria pilin